MRRGHNGHGSYRSHGGHHGQCAPEPPRGDGPHGGSDQQPPVNNHTDVRITPASSIFKAGKTESTAQPDEEISSMFVCQRGALHCGNLRLPALARLGVVPANAAAILSPVRWRTRPRTRSRRWSRSHGRVPVPLPVTAGDDGKHRGTSAQRARASECTAAAPSQPPQRTDFFSQ